MQTDLVVQHCSPLASKQISQGLESPLKRSVSANRKANLSSLASDEQQSSSQMSDCALGMMLKVDSLAKENDQLRDTVASLCKRLKGRGF